MRISTRVVRTAIICAATFALAGAARAVDLTGAWATDEGACDKVFVTNGKETSLRQDSDMYGSGFVIDGRRIRGRTATCNVTKTQEKGDVVHMLASCATEIMYQNVQFSVRVLDQNRIARIFPGMDGMELPYYRCPTRSAPAK